MSDAEEKTEGNSSQPDTKPDEDGTASEKTSIEEKKGEGNAGEKPGEDIDEEPSSAPPASELENLLEVYPLREPGKDPRWALRIVWIWIGFVLLSLAFILTLLILGAIND